MKRYGFTLSEVIIATAVIGVIAAITFNSVQNILPDKDKAIVLKAYNTLYGANDDIFNNPSLYDLVGDSSCSTTKKVLQCKNRPSDKVQNTSHNSANYENEKKYPYLLAEHLELANTISVSSNTYTFTTNDGVAWTLTPKPNASNFTSYDIVINTGNTKRSNCTYSTSCTNPRQFKFSVNDKGVLSPVDNLTKAYLMSPDKMNNRSEDLKVAKSMNSSGNSSGSTNTGPADR